MPFDIDDFIERPFFRTVNGFAYCLASYRVSWRLLRRIPKILVWYVRALPELMRSLVPHWRDEALPGYLATIDDWMAVDRTVASDEELLAGVRALAIADARYWYSVAMVMGAAKVTDGLLNGFLTSRFVPGNLTSGVFLRGFPSKTLEAQRDLEAIARNINRGDSAESLLALVRATPAGELRVDVPLAGLYNVENALAATAGALALGLPPDAVEPALGSFRAAFGRQERFEVEGREVLVLLAKNPTGLNQVLRTIAEQPGGDGLSLLLFLNDGIADGRDISWIWDSDYELIAALASSVVVSGTRADELALRLKYADLAIEPVVSADTGVALDEALSRTAAGATLYVVPTYTAMLEVRELLARRGRVAPYWEQG